MPPGSTGQIPRYRWRYHKQKGLTARSRKSFAAKVEAKGVEPLARSPEPSAPQQPAETTPRDLAYSWACNSEIDPDLARILSAWPMLPVPIRRAMLALVESGN